MKALFISSEYPAVCGGAGAMAVVYLESMQRKGHCVTLLTHKRERNYELPKGAVEVPIGRFWNFSYRKCLLISETEH